MASDYPLGIGLGNFHHFVMDYVPGLEVVRSAHNTYAACLAELGWPGLIVFLAILGFSLHQLKSLQRLLTQLDASRGGEVDGRAIHEAILLSPVTSHYGLSRRRRNRRMTSIVLAGTP